MNDNQSTPPSTSWLDTLRSLPGKALQGIKRLMPGSSSSNETGPESSTSIGTGQSAAPAGGRRRNRKSKKQATKKAGRRRGSRKSSRRS